MPAALSWGEALPGLLGALGAAEQRDRKEEAIVLRMEILSQRLGELSDDEVKAAVTIGDLKLLYNQGQDLRALGRPAEALRAWDVGQEYAGFRDDPYSVKLFGILGTHCHIDLLDLPAAARRLHAVLDQHPDSDPEKALRQAQNLAAPASSPADTYALRLEALYALGRYAAAVGQLGRADRIFAEALELPAVAPSSTISLEELAILLQEVRLDRGDFAGCERLRAKWSERPMSELGRLKWQLLRGTSLMMRAQLSEAEQLLNQMLKERPLSTAPAAYRPCLRAAAWQRNHALCALNRIDEAEELLHLLSREGGWDLEDLRAMAAIQGAHRLAAVRELPLTAREILGREQQQPGEHADATDLDTPLCRTRERARDEWARVANAILLDLQHQRMAQAQKRFAWLEPWATAVDSPLITARLWYLRALVSYYSTDYPTAAEAARESMRRSVDLGMLADEWAACRLYRWTIERLGASTEIQDQYLHHTQDLERQISAALTDADRVLYRLNKWSETDRQIAQQMRELRVALEQSDKQQTGLRGWVAKRSAQRRVQASLLSALSSKRWNSIQPEQVHPAALDDQRTAPAKTALAGPYSPAQHQIALRTHLPRSHSFGDFSPRWLDAETAVLSYVVLPDRLEVFLGVRSEIELLTLSTQTSRIELWHAVRRLLRALWYDQWGEERLQWTLSELAGILGLPEILASLRARGASIRRLCIVPDDVLFHVPFAALPVDAEPLCTRFAVSLLPHLEWGLHCPFAALPLASGLGVAVENTTVCSKTGKPFNRLPSAVLDVETLARVTAGLFTQLPDAAGPATKERVLSLLPRAVVAHFACHSDFDAAAPHASGLVLYDDYLTIDDLGQTRLHGLRLAVLGSCFGGNVAVLPGRELVGIPMALLEQGAGAAITALWEVDDSFSPRFSAALFPAVSELGPIDGLARAQRELWKTCRPRDWAAYLVFQNRLTPTAPWRWLVWLGEKLLGVHRV